MIYSSEYQEEVDRRRNTRKKKVGSGGREKRRTNSRGSREIRGKNTRIVGKLLEE